MPIRPVRIYGDPVLRQRAQEVEAFDASLAELADDMWETMRAYRGVGLAANQVGVLQRVLVIEVPAEGERESLRLALVNPTLSEASGSESGEEGCLSIPGIYEEVKRSTRVRVQGRDVGGRRVDMIADGYLARVLQHEVDHLDGVLFLDRLSPLKRQFLRRPLEALARGELPEDYRPPIPGETI